MKKTCKAIKSRLYLLAATVTQALSLVVLFFSLTAKKKNPMAAILSILALEGGTSLFLMAHLHKDFQQLTMSGHIEPCQTEEEEETGEDEPVA